MYQISFMVGGKRVALYDDGYTPWALARDAVVVINNRRYRVTETEYAMDTTMPSAFADIRVHLVEQPSTRQLADTHAQIDCERRRVAVVDAIADKIIADYVDAMYNGTRTGRAARSIRAIREAVDAGYRAGKAERPA